MMCTFLLIGLGIFAVLIVLRCWAASSDARRGGLSQPDGHGRADGPAWDPAAPATTAAEAVTVAAAAAADSSPDCSAASAAPWPATGCMTRCRVGMAAMNSAGTGLPGEDASATSPMPADDESSGRTTMGVRAAPGTTAAATPAAATGAVAMPAVAETGAAAMPAEIGAAAGVAEIGESPRCVVLALLDRQLVDRRGRLGRADRSDILSSGRPWDTRAFGGRVKGAIGLHGSIR